ncbi:MAG: hypothetical protein EOO88_62500 [Pedobacter sp.]|nr:MAG: hypothetical protein EOO88_62500 [Pedobacter sp.]
MKLFFGILTALLLCNVSLAATNNCDTIPSKYLGNFVDDYKIRYSVSDSLFIQHPNVKYHILSWNLEGQYIIASNDAGNPSEQNLYTRIDFMDFQNMAPFLWGFCFTRFDAIDAEAAEAAASADRQHPKKGCGGFPFSRMKRE